MPRIIEDFFKEEFKMRKFTLLTISVFAFFILMANFTSAKSFRTREYKVNSHHQGTRTDLGSRHRYPRQSKKSWKRSYRPSQKLMRDYADTVDNSRGRFGVLFMPKIKNLNNRYESQKRNWNRKEKRSRKSPCWGCK